MSYKVELLNAIWKHYFLSTRTADFYKIEFLCRMRVEIEAKRFRREILQYTLSDAKYCYRTPRWAKCAQEHFSNKCSWTEKTNNGKICALCSGNLSANYKLCNIYQEQLTRKYRKLREKLQAKMKKFNNSNFYPNPIIVPGLSYSRVASKKVPTIETYRAKSQTILLIT